MKKFVAIIFVNIMFFGCNHQSSDNLLFEKLQGTWKINTKNEYEKWSKNPDGSYNSVMYSVNVNDTFYTESVKIYKKESRWIFETYVKSQNDGKVVEFESVQLNDAEVTFANPEHDFPKYIHYTLKEPSVLIAYIAGNSDTVFFNFLKVK